MFSSVHRIHQDRSYSGPPQKKASINLKGLKSYNICSNQNGVKLEIGNRNMWKLTHS